jgi:hypothetical protein
VAEATRKHVDNSERPDPDWAQGYGYQFWMARHGYRGDGAFGQFCVVLPEHDTVVVTTALTEEMQFVLDAMWEHLLPGLGVATGDADAQEALAARLQGLRLPVPSAASTHSGAGRGWTDAPFRVVGSAAAGSSSSLSSVGVSTDGPGWQLTLSEPGNALTFPVGHGDWAVSSPTDSSGARIPVAAAGGWRETGAFCVDVLFLETPHRMEVTCSLTDREARAVWRHAPLGSDRLEHLRCP